MQNSQWNIIENTTRTLIFDRILMSSRKILNDNIIISYKSAII